MKRKTEVVLSALFNEEIVQLNGNFYFLNKDFTLMFMRNLTGNDVFDYAHSIPIDLTISSFLKMCENLNKEDFLAIECNHESSRVKE